MERIVYIENIYPDVDVSVLCDKFRVFGNILSASIDYDEKFHSLGKGQILFQNPASAKAAKKMNGVFAFGRPLVVKLPPSSNGNFHKSFVKVFVKNFDLLWDECDLQHEFKKFGEVVDAKVFNTDGKSNGYGYVVFKQHASAAKAVKEMNDVVIGDKVLAVEPYVPKELRKDITSKSLDYAKDILEKSTQFNNLHVKNLPKSADEMVLRKLFESFGEITSVFVARDDSRKSKGFGFVAFKDAKDAEKARFRMNGYSYNSNILEVNFNQPKDKRHHYLQLVSETKVKKPFNETVKKRGKSVDSPRRPVPIYSFTASKQY